MSGFTRLISFLLLVVFGLILIPFSLLHELYGHEDTHCTPGESTSIETQHTHCKILQIEAQVYTTPATVKLLSVPAILTFWKIQQQAIPSFATMLYADLRAPPAV
jgi:hypothetical protein